MEQVQSDAVAAFRGRLRQDCRANGGHVVGAGDGDGYDFGNSASSRDCKFVCVGLPHTQLVVRRVGNISPYAIGANAELAVAVGASNPALHSKLRICR